MIRTLAVLLVLVAAPALAREYLSDADIQQQILADAAASYVLDGHVCACPYHLTRNGTSCGRRSPYRRVVGGWGPVCYASDVTPEMITEWRRTHPGR